jgi:hypothetical protein
LRRIQLPGRMTDFNRWLDILREHSHSSAPAAAYSSRAETASALLKVLEIYGPVLDELRAASRRPYARFNVEYNADDPASTLVVHLPVLNRAAQVLRLRASAELAAGQTGNAMDDIRQVFFLADSIRSEPFFVSQVVRMEFLTSAEQVIWEGLAGRRWTDSQLREFESRLGKIAFIPDLELAVRAEGAGFGNTEFQFIRAHPNVLRDWLAENENTFWAFSLIWGPRGWLYQEQIACQHAYQEMWLPALDAGAGLIHPQIVDRDTAMLNQIKDGSFSAVVHHQVFLKLLFPGIKIFQNAGFAQTEADEAAVACALERCRVATGKFPESLDALAPAYIDKVPVELCSGQPLKYRRGDDGRFILYSTGWDEKDDGGTVVMDNGGYTQDLTRGDWVWPQYPGQQP